MIAAHVYEDPQSTAGSGGRDTESGRFLPGRSPNPGGRPKGVAARVRELAGDDGGALLEIVATIASDTRASNRDRLEACRLLLDRGFGRSPAVVYIEGAETERPSPAIDGYKPPTYVDLVRFAMRIGSIGEGDLAELRQLLDCDVIDAKPPFELEAGEPA